MKKHLIRALIVMLTVCFGVGVLAACGDLVSRDPEEPVADLIEGVWTGATADIDNEGKTTTFAFTATVDLDGDSVRTVYTVAEVNNGTVGEVWTRGYVALAKQTDGSYKFEETQGSSTASFAVTLNGSNLEAVVKNMFGEDSTVTLTFPTKSALPDGLGLTGTWYELKGTSVGYDYPEEAASYDFTNKKYTVSGNQKNMTVYEVGAYTVCLVAGADRGNIIYKSGSDYYVNGSYTKLTQTAPSNTPASYTVTYALGEHAASEAEVPPRATANAANAYTVELPAAPAAAEDWEFAGWDVGGQVKQPGDEITVTDDITVTATWRDTSTPPTPASYTVTYALGEHAASEAEVPPQATANAANAYTVELPAAPEAAQGWEFAGWQVGSTVEQPEAPITVSDDITVTAKWTQVATPAISYTVTYALGEHAASEAEVPPQATANAANAYTVELPAAPAAAKGYEFAGWQVGNATEEAGDEITVSDNITVTATYDKITYQVHYILNKPAGVTDDVTYNSDTDSIADTTVQIGGSVATPTSLKLNGYKFLGWKISTDPNASAYLAASYPIKESDLPENSATHEITFTAQWKLVTYTVKFNLGSGGSTTDTVTFTEKGAGVNVAIPKVNTFKGYELTGWQLQDKETTLEKDATEYTVTAADAATVSGADSEIVFIAQYDYITYTVKFDVDSGKPAEVDAAVQGAHTDATITVEDMPSRRVTFPSVSLEGYVVTGWKLSTTQETKTGATYQVKDTDLPENTAVHEITFTAQWGEPDYTGVWTDYIINGYKVGSDKFDLYFEITIQSDEANGFDVVWKEYYTDDDFVDHATYVFGNFKKEGSVYKMTAKDGTAYTLQVNAKYQLVLGKTFTEGDPFNATLEGDHDPLPAVRITEPAAGTYYVRYTRSDYTETKYTFAAEGNDTIKTSASGSEIVISYKAVGSYLVISGDGVATHTLYKNGNLYYTTLLNNDETDAQLTTEEPPLTPETADITFEFTSNPNRSGVKPQGMPAEDFTGTHRVGQSFNLPTAPTDENGAREFVWWETANGDHYAAGASYEVKAADAEAVMGEGFNPQVVGYKIVFTAEWTMTYKVEYLSLTEDGTKDTAVSCGTDGKTYKTNEQISIIDDEPSKGDATFLGWKLYLYNADQGTYTPVRAVEDILYKKGTDHATYTPDNSENKNAEKEPVALAFVAQWDDAEEPTTDINGVWSSEDYILTVKVEGSTGHAIVKSTDGETYTYFALTEADGTYSGGTVSQTITITPAGSDLSVKIAYGGFGAFVTYTRTSDLPAALEIEGTYKGDDGYDSVTINFTDKTVDGAEATFENIGDYILVKATGNYLVYKDGEKFYVSTANFTLELKQQGGGTEPQPTVDIEGVWTGDNIEITIDLDEGGETGYAVIKTGTNYQYTALTKSGDEYTGTVNYMPVTFAIEGDSLKYSSGDVTLSARTDLPAHIKFAGKWSMTTTSGEVKVDFDSKKIEVGSSYDFTEVVAGGYVVVYFKMSTYQDAGLYIYKDADKYYGVIPALELYTPAEFTSAGGTAETETETEPQTATDIEGVWTKDNLTITIKLEEGGETGHAVVKNGTNYFYTALTKDGDEYSGTVNYYPITFKLTAEGLVYNDGQSADTTLTEKQALTPLALEGEYKETSNGITINFTDKTFSMSGSQQATFIDVGDFIVIQLPNMENASLFVYKSGNRVYAYIDAFPSTVELTQA